MFIFFPKRNTLRITRAAALQGTTDTGNTNTFLGKQGKDFDFMDLKPLKVEFAECSALGEDKDKEKAQLGDLYSWINRVA